MFEVIEVLGTKIGHLNGEEASALSSLQTKNPAYTRLLQQRTVVNRVIEEVVKVQHSALNNCVDTMGSVLAEYTASRTDVSQLISQTVEV
jgi:hypothetical protein